MGNEKNPEKASKTVEGANPWGHFRAQRQSAQVWTQLERRGYAIVLGQPSNHTATEMRRDYDLLFWNVRQLNQWIHQTRESGRQPTLEEAKKAFNGTIIVGDETQVPYLTDKELQEQIAHPETPSSFSERIVTKRWGFTEASGKTYIRRKTRSEPAE